MGVVYFYEFMELCDVFYDTEWPFLSYCKGSISLPFGVELYMYCKVLEYESKKYFKITLCKNMANTNNAIEERQWLETSWY